MVGILTVVPSRKRDCVALPAAKHYRKSLLSKTLKILGNIQTPCLLLNITENPCYQRLWRFWGTSRPHVERRYSHSAATTLPQQVRQEVRISGDRFSTIVFRTGAIAHKDKIVNLESPYLIIIACSRRKLFDTNLLPAIERYDGPTFRLLRRFLRDQPSAALDIYILSAKFGLIPSDYPIPNYDEKMTRDRSRQLQPLVIAKLKNILNAKPYQQLCICLGRDYFLALDKYDMLIKSGLVVRIATGSLGKKRRFL